MTKFFHRIFAPHVNTLTGFIPHLFFRRKGGGQALILRRAQDRVKDRRSFTLIELLVVLAVSILLSSSLILYNHTSRQQIALYVDEAKLVQVISRAKSLSLSTYHESASEICGYGVHIDYGTMSYTLFSYTKPATVECEKITSVDPGAEESLSVFFLSKELLFMATSSGGGNRIDDVIFIPPDPVTLMNSEGSFITNGFGSIALGTQDGSFNAVVTVSSAGQISF